MKQAFRPDPYFGALDAKIGAKAALGLTDSQIAHELGMGVVEGRDRVRLARERLGIPEAGAVRAAIRARPPVEMHRGRSPWQMALASAGLAAIAAGLLAVNFGPQGGTEEGRPTRRTEITAPVPPGIPPASVLEDFRDPPLPFLPR
jgi:hypothetical protein